MRGFLLLGALAGVCLATASCSGQTGSSSNGGGGSGSVNPATASGFCNGTIGAVLGYFDSHCTAEDKKSASYLFLFAFLASAPEECGTTLQKSIDNGRASLNADSAASCVDGYKRCSSQAAESVRTINR